MTFLMQKPEAYGLDKPSLNFLNDCLRFWTQRSKIGSSYNDWANVTRSIPRVSIVLFLSMTFSYILKIFLTITDSSLV